MQLRQRHPGLQWLPHAQPGLLRRQAEDHLLLRLGVRQLHGDDQLGTGVFHAADATLQRQPLVTILQAQLRPEADLAGCALLARRHMTDLLALHPDAGAANFGRQQVDAWCANETRHLHVRRLAVDLVRRAELQHTAFAHDGHTVGHGHGLVLVVRDVDEGDAELVVQLPDLGAQGLAQVGVEVGQWLVEQEHRRVPHHGARQGHALTLATRELRRLAPPQRVNAQAVRHLACAGLGRGVLAPYRRQQPAHARQALPEVQAAHQQRRADVFAHRHVRVEGVTLEHHGAVAFAGRQRQQVALAEVQGTGVGLVQAGDQAQQGGLAAARGAEQGEELAVAHGEVQALEHVGGAELFAQAVDVDVRHGSSPEKRSGRWTAGQAARE